MKKIILIIVAFLMLGILMKSEEKEYYVIPDESIRLRILANSNSIYDQYIKSKVKEEIEKELKDIVEQQDTIEEMRITVQENIPRLEKAVQTVLQKEDSNMSFTVDYGNHKFPEKEYKGVKYEEGDYESLVITIGEGEGNNWWCVLFPPLCTMEVEEEQEVTYRFFIKDIIDKYLIRKDK